MVTNEQVPGSPTASPPGGPPNGAVVSAATRLGGSIDGDVLLPDAAGYDDSRTLWNIRIDRRPAAIVRCASESDVAAAVRFARENDLEIGVKCGGHSGSGHAVPDGGLMIDLTRMNRVSVDPAARTARVAGGSLLGSLDRASTTHGLATTAGNVSHTGVGGLTLGGGMGWLARQHGLSCDNVRSYRLVTADGETVTANATENPDLYWGLRGGGGNFGVVTEFEFRLHPITGSTVVAEYSLELDDAAAAMRGWRELCRAAPRQATFTAWTGPVDGRPRATLGFVWVGDPAESLAWRGECAGLGPLIDQRVTEQSYVRLQSMDDDVQGHRFRRYWKGHYLKELPDAAFDAFLCRGTADGTGDLLPNASLQAHGGAIAEVPDDDCAFSHRDTFVEYVCSSRWTDQAEDDGRIEAARRCAGAIDPFASGVYVNVLIDEGSRGVRRAYPEQKLTRLTELKDRWDPDNVFHLNHNIVPTAAV